MKEKYTDKETLGAFLLVNDYRMLSNEELTDVKVSITNLLKENESLKKELEELMKTNNVLTRELTKDSDIKQKYLTTCCGIPIGNIPKLKDQQKEFVNYLEDRIKSCDEDYYDNFDYIGIYEEILSKYKEIIGGENE